MNIRERIEQTEYKMLSPYATKSRDSRGTVSFREKCALRTDFQRDRDRVIHSKAFRRLKHKTQVFITPEGDHYRTRLTHTLEVSQIGRTIARSLMLNEDLTEAIALAHDLGHTPFGHAGEAALNALSPRGFRHNEQSLRVVDVLEELNLTHEVRDGIVAHTGDAKPNTPEAAVIKFADKIAYINHDIDDAMRAKILLPHSIPKRLIEVLGEKHGDRINTMVHNVVENSEDGVVKMSAEVLEATLELRQFMFDNVYVDSKAKTEEKKVLGIMEGLYGSFMKNPHLLPAPSQALLQKHSLEETVCDYVAGMTDRFAIYMYNELFVPKSWHKL
ncbi:MAG: deoxyguanosinetriphosphate triphosphohydrolase [Clostridia bacterium]|nr:deoxyguanosinetriphosphate triphosphohydrolase [Clostridia bacterium]